MTRILLEFSYTTVYAFVRNDRKDSLINTITSNESNSCIAYVHNSGSNTPESQLFSEARV